MPINPSKRKDFICPNCKKAFSAPYWRWKRVKNIYCSAKCAKHKIVKQCDWCKKQFKKAPSAIKAHNFCCRKCCGAWQSANNVHSVPRSQVVITCATCGKNFERQPNQIKRNKLQYCSRSCFAEGHRIRMSGDKNPAWRGGREQYYGVNWNNIAEQIRKRDKFQCVRCNLPQTMLTKKLHVHHIKPLRDFNRDFQKANVSENLVSLCPRCHKFLEWHEELAKDFYDALVTTNQSAPAQS